MKRAAEVDLDVVLLIDDSGSTFTTDPFGHRYVAARRLVQSMIRSGGWTRFLKARARGRVTRVDRFVLNRKAWAADRVTVISFTDHPTRVLPASVLPEEIDLVNDALAGPGPTGGTALAPALRRVAAATTAPPPSTGRSRRTIVLVFTDGEVFDSEDDLREARASLPPATVHLVSLGPQPRRAAEHLRNLQLDLTTLGSIDDPRALEQVLIRATSDATFAALGGPAPPSPPSPPDPDTGTGPVASAKPLVAPGAPDPRRIEPGS